MATKTDDGTSGCIFQWEIENISHCWLKKGEKIKSPAFIADAVEGTKWSLWLYPMGEEDENFISFDLHRVEDGSGPDVIQVNYQMAFLDKDGSISNEVTNSKENFEKSHFSFYRNIMKRNRVFLTEREVFLPEDTLTIQCKIWNKTEQPIKMKHLYARTVFKLNRRSLMWRISGFSTLKSSHRKKFKDNLIHFDIVLNEDFDKLDIDMISFDEQIKCFSCNTRIIDSEGKKENCGIKKYSFSTLRKGVLSPTLLCLRKLIENKNRYLPNDVLSLEFVFTVGEYISDKRILNLKRESYGVSNDAQEKSQNTKVLTEELKSMFYDGIFSDTELRTSRKTFPAHKNILSARSPVFRNMLSQDMKEANSGHVDITDLEDDTVHRMLLYKYTDALEDLQLESASKLYAAADKYEILSLKSRCSTFMKDNLCPTKVCSILVLADLHHDNDLKSFVENYILDYDKEVIGCKEWKDFMNTNPKLAAYVMYRKFCPD